MSRMFQISEEDLRLLEEQLPALMDATASACNDPIVRERWQMVQKTLVNVRWNYGPYLEVETLDGGGG